MMQLTTQPVFCCSGGAAAADAVEKLAASSHLLQAAAWQLAGNRSLAEASALTHLGCYQDSASSADHAVAYAQLAQIAMSKKGYRSVSDQLLSKVCDLRVLSMSFCALSVCWRFAWAASFECAMDCEKWLTRCGYFEASLQVTLLITPL